MVQSAAVPGIRIVLTADTHLGTDLPQRERVQRRRRGDDFFANYERVLGHALETRPDILLHAGDFFDHSRVRPGVVSRAFEALRAVAEAGITVVAVPGNHERGRLPQSLWLQHPDIHVIRKPRTVLIETAAGPCAIGGFPFVRGPVRTAFPALAARTGICAAPAGLRLLAFHQAVEGAVVGPVDFRFSQGRDVIAAASLPRMVTAVLAGHVHRAQVLPGRDGGPRVFYPGSVERTSFAEAGETKGFFDLAFAPGASGRWQVGESEFITLPARAMIEVVIPADLPLDGLAPFLRRAATRIDRDAVVRVSLDAGARPDIARALSASTLRALFPSSMNVEPGWRTRHERG